MAGDRTAVTVRVPRGALTFGWDLDEQHGAAAGRAGDVERAAESAASSGGASAAAAGPDARISS
jgi:hypothetical protein